MVAVGDYFVSSWGYDQTLITFFKVVGTTAKSVRVVRVDNVITGREGIDEMVIPGSTVRAQPQTKRLRQSSFGPAFKFTDYADAYLWNGKPCAQTDPRFGR